MEMHAFIQATKPKHLTVGDVLSLGIGHILDVVLWDGNFEEYGLWQTWQQNEIVPAQLFFQNNRASFVKTAATTWRFGWRGDPLCYEHEIHIIDEHGRPCPLDRPLAEYDPAMRVGWRGPMMLWSHLTDSEDAEQVYWN